MCTWFFTLCYYVTGDTILWNPLQLEWNWISSSKQTRRRFRFSLLPPGHSQQVHHTFGWCESGNHRWAGRKHVGSHAFRSQKNLEIKRVSFEHFTSYGLQGGLSRHHSNMDNSLIVATWAWLLGLNLFFCTVPSFSIIYKKDFIAGV